MSSPLIHMECTSCDHKIMANRAYVSVALSASGSFRCSKCRNPMKKSPAKKKGLSESQKRSKKQEKRVASKFGGDRTAASGALSIKGDVRNPFVSRVECKSTKAKSYSLKLAELLKIESEAAHSEDPIFHIEFAGQSPARRYVVIPEWVYEKLINEN